MTEYTSQVIALEEAYHTMLATKARVRAEIKDRHRRQMRRETDEAMAEAEYQFANKLLAEHERGLPVGVIQDSVLHTKDWKTWRKWRDMAGIKPARVVMADAKAEKEANAERAKITFKWQEGVLYVLKNPVTGTPFEHDLALPFYTKGGGPDTGYGNYNRYLVTTDFDEDYMSYIPELSDKEAIYAYHKAIRAEVVRAFKEGELTENYSPREYADYEDSIREYDRLYELNPWVEKGAGK